jgi:hypothetical protein
LYWKETYPPEIRKEMQELLAEAVAKTRAGSMYHVKTKYYRDAHRPFFELGEFKDDIRRVTFACPRANPISVDGDLTEWKDMSPLLMRDNATGEDVKAKTEIFTAHDRDKFYVAGRVHEVGKVVLPPTRVPRDGDIYSYDSIEVYFCTDQERFDEAGVAKLDQHHLFMVNARGEFLDGYKSTGDRHAIRKVNFDVEYDVKPLGRGFQFEMAFPYKAIHALAPQPGDFWYINFYRNRPRDDDSPRYHAFAPTKSAFSNTSRFAVMEFPKKVLLLYDFKDKNPEFSVWKKPSPEAVCAHEIKDGIACLKVKYPKTAKKNGRITFSISPGAPKVDKPFQSHYRFRYRGQGVNSITFHLRSIGWAQQNVKYTPLHPAEEKVDIKEWQTVVGDRTYQYVKGNQEFPTHPSDINRIGIGLDMIPGADVVIELDEIRIVEK